MGPALVGPEASAWAAPAPCSCPGPGYSRVSLVPKLRPSPTPPTPELEPTCGTALAACPLPAMGQPGLPVPGDSGSAGVPACRPGGQPLLVSQSIGSTAQCSGPPSVSSLLAGLSFLPGSSTSWFSPQASYLVSAGGTSALGCAEPLLPSDWTARGPGLGSSSSRRDAVREEGRWGSSDVARPPLPLPVPGPGFLPSHWSPPAIPDQWAQMHAGPGPISRTGWEIRRGLGPAEWRGQG